MRLLLISSKVYRRIPPSSIPRRARCAGHSPSDTAHRLTPDSLLSPRGECDDRRAFLPGRVNSRYNEETGWPETGPPSPQQTSWYTYDDLGNRISHKYRSSGAIGYAHDKANRMTTLANRTQGYDLAGNLTLAYSADRNTSYTYRWDHHNRLTGVYDSTNTTRKAAFAYDALGRRIEFINDKLTTTNRYYYDGVNEIVEDNESAARQKYYVHGVSYVDERVMMYHDGNSRPYYYVLDRMYNVRAMVDRAGAIVEVYRYDGYGRPKIRESCGRGDMNDDSRMNATDDTRFDNALAASIWDPRADLDDDGDVDSSDETLYDAKKPDWNGGLGEGPTVDQAFSDVDNWYMFQGVPHLALDNLASDTAGKLMINHHRARYADATSGRWKSRDPLREGHEKENVPTLIDRYDGSVIDKYNFRIPSLYLPDRLYCYLNSNPLTSLDPLGTCTVELVCWGAFGSANPGQHCEWSISGLLRSDGLGSCHGTGGPNCPNAWWALECCGLCVYSAWDEDGPTPSGGQQGTTVWAGSFPDSSVCDCIRQSCDSSLPLCWRPLPILSGSGNSNTAAKCLGQRCGLAPTSLPVWAPGWDAPCQ